ncbi:hypothetical protein EYV96_15255 [Dyella terrae]|uniref:Uncharacterized protein n=2 Tax=Dyella TaxID=231454 RepID=A0A4R0YNV2_9GAMM|nr:hypothetical protein [Dyella soli]TBR37235.1 hypothetical protein EYV96_15255 [Dyella terrae]TCI07675.1 hypothetical protein EZM97_23615 [Dyella soli]
MAISLATAPGRLTWTTREDYPALTISSASRKEYFNIRDLGRRRSQIGDVLPGCKDAPTRK